MWNKSCAGKCGCAMIGWILLIIGGINWGLVGVGYFFDANWNVVNLLLGNWMWLEAVVYILVGVAGVMSLFGCKCKKCMTCNCEGCGTAAPTQGAPMN